MGSGKKAGVAAVLAEPRRPLLWWERLGQYDRAVADDHPFDHPAQQPAEGVVEDRYVVRAGRHVSGVWDQRYDQIDDLDRARRLPSPQLVGTPERATLDLNALTALGVGLVGRWAAVRDGTALFSGGLRNVCALADLKMTRLLTTFDEWARATGRDAEVGPPERYPPTAVPEATRLRLDLRGGEIGSVVWATGFRPAYGWLHVPVFDAKGRLRHDGGVLDLPGMYALGLPMLRRRRSTYINGITDDARAIVDHLARTLAVRHPS